MSYQELPVQMHPRYAEFLAFMTECPHRKTPSTMETAFWAWLKIMAELCGHRWIETDKPYVFEKTGYSQDVCDLAVFSSNQAVEIQILKKDLDRKHRECAERERQVLMLAEDNERLNDDLKRAKDALATVLMGLGGHAIGERGNACLSIDGGNL